MGSCTSSRRHAYNAHMDKADAQRELKTSAVHPGAGAPAEAPVSETLCSTSRAWVRQVSDSTTMTTVVPLMFADGSPRPAHVVVVAGPPASGKGTVCDGIEKRYGLVHVSPGQILRDHIKQRTPLGVQAQGYIEAGQPAPDELVMEVVKDRLSRADVAARGCLLDNFPLTLDQAASLQDEIPVDRFIYLEVPDAVLVDRAVGRRLDPQTGRIYHLKSRLPPPEIQDRLVIRRDDAPEAVRTRLNAFNAHMRAILDSWQGTVYKVDGLKPPDAVLGAVAECLDTLEWSTDDSPYFGNVAFNGPFDELLARRAGFYSTDFPPEVGDEVVCFRRGADWNKRGRVVDVQQATSMGSTGLRDGVEGARVTVELMSELQVMAQQHTTSTATKALSNSSLTLKPKRIEPVAEGSMESWAAFLAPINDMEYSSICTTHAFLSSSFCRLYSCSRGMADADFVTKEEARDSLIQWLNHLEDTDGEPFELNTKAQEEILGLFDTHTDGVLYLYTTQQKLGPRTSLSMGQDFSLYYRALNNTLNNDAEGNLCHAMPLIQRMTYLLLYNEESGERRLHPGGRAWKGDAQRPVPLNMHKLREACRLGKVVRFRQFQSTTVNEELANKYLRREDGRGYKWIIDIPSAFWGARDIKDISWRQSESETLFPPYSAFLVESVQEDVCHLRAVDRRVEVSARAERHGLRSGSVIGI